MNIAYEKWITVRINTGKLFCWAASITFPWLHVFPALSPTLGIIADFSLTSAEFPHISSISRKAVTPIPPSDSIIKKESFTQVNWLPCAHCISRRRWYKDLNSFPSNDPSTPRKTGGDHWNVLVQRGWRLFRRTWNPVTSPWMKQLIWLRIVHSAEIDVYVWPYALLSSHQQHARIVHVDRPERLSQQVPFRVPSVQPSVQVCYMKKKTTLHCHGEPTNPKHICGKKINRLKWALMAIPAQWRYIMT